MAEQISAEERARVRRQAAEQSVKLATAGKWEQAAGLNRDLLARIGGDVEAYNRLGKALSELGQLDDAREAYRSALRMEPGNSIARRNLDRLATMREAAAPAAEGGQGRGRFIEESGKAARISLQAVNPARLAPLDAGDEITLQVQGNAVNALDGAGNYLGMLDPRVGLRLSKLIGGGNRYSASVVTTSGNPQIIVRELFQHPSQIGKVSFPQGRVSSEVRAYTRPTQAHRDDEFEPDIDDEDDGSDSDGGDGDGDSWEDDAEVPMGSMSDDDDDEDESLD